MSYENKNVHIREKKFKSVEEMLDHISPWGESPELNGFVFRGQSQESYELVPSALRLSDSESFFRKAGCRKPDDGSGEYEHLQVALEYQLLRAFYRLADQRGLAVPISNRVRANLSQEIEVDGIAGLNQPDYWLPTDLYETAALAQHYGIPTRLIDWTYDIYIALYFAFRGGIGRGGSMVVWAINKEYLSMIKNTVSRVNVEFITPHYSGNPNLSAQKGLFTLWPLLRPSKAEEFQRSYKQGYVAVDRSPLDKLVLSSPMGAGVQVFKKFVLPCSEAIRGCGILDKLGYDTSRVFPGYGGVVEQLLTRYRYNG